MRTFSTRKTDRIHGLKNLITNNASAVVSLEERNKPRKLI